MTIRVVGVSSGIPQDPCYMFREFQESLDRVGHVPLLLGGGSDKGIYGGHGSKVRLLKEAIENGTVDTDYIIFCDTWDVLFTSSPEYILERYLALYGDSHLLFCAEKNCFPNSGLSGSHTATESAFKYLNAGGAIGATSLFHSVLVSMRAETIPDDGMLNGVMFEPSDQNLWMEYHCRRENSIVLDNNCEIFQSMHGVDPVEFDLTGGVLKNVASNSTPMVLHFNGGSKTGELRNVALNLLKL